MLRHVTIIDVESMVQNFAEMPPDPLERNLHFFFMEQICATHVTVDGHAEAGLSANICTDQKFLAIQNSKIAYTC